MIEKGYLLTLVLVLIILVTFSGNVLVCLSVIKVRKLRHPSNYLLISLAISDLCVACVVMPFGLYVSINEQWKLGSTLCNAYVVSDVTSCTASILNLCVISVDRYLAITQPLTYCVKRTTRLMLILIAAVWTLACLISIPPLLISGNEHGTATAPKCEVSQSLWYQLYATVISFYIPLVVMIVLYLKIYRAAKRVVEDEKRATVGLQINNNLGNHNGNNSNNNNTNINNNNNTITNIGNNINRNNVSIDLTSTDISHNQHQQHKSATTPTQSSAMKERKASITLGVIMSAFTICWLPFFIIAILRPFSSTVDSLPRVYVLLALWLGYANSLLNPIIYVTFHHDFRNAFKHLLCLRCMTINEHIRKDKYKSQYGETHYHEKTKRKSQLNNSFDNHYQNQHHLQQYQHNQQQQQQQQQLLYNESKSNLTHTLIS